MLIVFVRALLLYIVVIVSLRMMGKRQLGQLQPSELVVTILISNIASLPIENIDMPMLVGAIPVFALVGFELLMSTLTLRNNKLRRVISGNPIVIIKDGQILQKEMARLRFSLDDLMEALRQQSIFDVEDVYYAVVETTGNVSILQKKDKLTVTLEDMNIKKQDDMPPIVVISDGELVQKAISQNGFEIKRINSIVRRNNLNISDIFLMTLDRNYESYIVKKENKNQ